MAYLDRSQLYNDPTFQGRLQAAILTESRGRSDSAVATSALQLPTAALWTFLPWITSEPGFDVPESQVTDGMLLGAIQAVWPAVETQVAAGAT